VCGLGCSIGGRLAHLTLGVPQHAAEQGALALVNGRQTAHLLGVRVATGLAQQLPAFCLVRPGEGDAGGLGILHHFLPSLLQEPAVHGVSNGLLLHGGVHDDAAEAALVDGAKLHGRLDGGLEQQLHAFFAEQAPEATELRGIAGQARRVVLVAREVLPDDVLASMRCTSSSSDRP
jgi:hypothetical protein